MISKRSSVLLQTLFLSVVTFISISSEIAQAQSPTPGIKTDRAVYLEPALSIVTNAGERFHDPLFGTEIMRATDAADCPAPGCGTWYSQWPTFNSDNSRIMIRNGVSGGMIIKAFNPVTFTLGAIVRTSPTLPGGVSLEWQGATWSRTDPDLIFVHANYYNPEYAATGMKLYTYRPSTNVFTLLKDFAPELAPGQPDYLFEMHVAQDGKDDIFTSMLIRLCPTRVVVGYFSRSTRPSLTLPGIELWTCKRTPGRPRIGRAHTMRHLTEMSVLES